MTDVQAPAAYRGRQTAEDFAREVGHVWIGLIERIAAEDDQEAAFAVYFGTTVSVIRQWIDARGRARCTARLAPDRRCANLVGQRVEYDPRVWEADRSRCAAHISG